MQTFDVNNTADPAGEWAMAPDESASLLRLTAGELEASRDLPRRLLELFRVLRPGGEIDLEIAPRQGRKLTGWTEIFTEILFPHLAALPPPPRAFSPGTLGSIMRRLFGERVNPLPPDPSAEQPGLRLRYRKARSLDQAFPWLIEDCSPAVSLVLRAGDSEASPTGSRQRNILDFLMEDSPGPAGQAVSSRQGLLPETGDRKAGRSGVSIVMATRQARAILPVALTALLAQRQPPCELLVQDAASTDGTVEAVQDFAARASFPVDLVSEPDGGVYDAWNRAIARSQGDWLLFLGADDALLGPEVLASALPLLTRLPSRIMLAYGGLAFYRDGKMVDLWNPEPGAALERMRFAMGLPFPATFLRASIFREHRFDTSYRIAGDYRLVAEVAKPDNLAQLPLLVTLMNLGGLSSNPRHHLLTEAERFRVVRETAALLESF